MSEFTEDWFSGNIPNWQQWLGKYAGHACAILEIGCFEGRATVWLLKNILTHKDSRITCIDCFKLEDYRPGCKERFLANTRPWFGKVELREGTSRAVLPKLTERRDVIYIDGSHKADDVFQDAMDSWRLLRIGGLMIFDDYEWPCEEEPGQLTKLGIDRFLSFRKNRRMIIERNHQVVIKKLKE